MRKPKSVRAKDIKAKKEFNKKFSKLNDLQRLELLGLNPRDAFKMARQSERKKIEVKVIDATNFYNNIPEDFFDKSRLTDEWICNKINESRTDDKKINSISDLINETNQADSLISDSDMDLLLEYRCYKIAVDSITDNVNELVFTDEIKKKILAYFSYICSSFNEPNHYSHNGTIIENINASTIYTDRNENGEVQVDLTQIMNAEIHNNGAVECKISKMEILKFIQNNDKFMSDKI